MQTRLFSALERGVVFYPCSGFDFNMIHEMQKFNPNTKDFIYCNSMMPDGWSEDPNMLETRIVESGFTFEKINEVEINSIKCIDIFYANFIKIYGDDFEKYVSEIKNLITHYVLRYGNLTVNLFYISAESLTLFNWLNSLKIKYNKNSKNTLVINAPGGGWLNITEDFIALLYEQSRLFNSTAIHNSLKKPPYQSVNQN